MTDAHSLHLSQLRRAADPHAARCPYYRRRGWPRVSAWLFLPSCSRGRRSAPTCGARSARPTRSPRRRPPGLSAVMVRVTIGELALLECAACAVAGSCRRLRAHLRRIAKPSGGSARWNDRAPRRPARGSVPAVRCVRKDDEPRELRPLVRERSSTSRGHGTFLDAASCTPSSLHHGRRSRPRTAARKDDLEKSGAGSSVCSPNRRHNTGISEWEHRGQPVDVRRILKDE